jgi:hypothetical protein
MGADRTTSALSDPAEKKIDGDALRWNYHTGWRADRARYWLPSPMDDILSRTNGIDLTLTKSAKRLVNGRDWTVHTGRRREAP